MSPNFLDFFVLFRSSDLYTHQNPSLLLFHSAGHRHACIVIETPFVTFVPIVPREKMSPRFLTFSFCFVPVIYTPIRIHRYSCSIVLDTDMPVLSLKLPLLHLFQSLHGKGVPNFFKDKCSDKFLVQSSLNFCYICYSVTGVTKCVCWKICVLFVKYL